VSVFVPVLVIAAAFSWAAFARQPAFVWRLLIAAGVQAGTLIVVTAVTT
jgi:hypothetical protein